MFPNGQQLNMILDDGGDLTNLVHDKYPDLMPGEFEWQMYRWYWLSDFLTKHTNFSATL